METKLVLSPGWECKPISLLAGKPHPLVIQKQEELWQHRQHPTKNIEISQYNRGWVAARGLIFSDKSLDQRTVGVHGAEEVATAVKLVKELNEPHVTLSGSYLLMKRPGATCYGHWLIEILPALRIFKEAAGGDVNVIVQKLSGGMRNVVFDSLKTLGIESKSVTETRAAVYEVETLFAVTNAAETSKGFSPNILNTFRELSRGISSPKRRRIYVERNPEGTRAIRNNAQVNEAMKALGFDIVRPETLSFPEQIAIMKGADIVVGVTGSALTNIAFCRPETTVIALAPERVLDRFYWDLCGLCDLTYHEIRMPSEPNGKYPLAYDSPMVVDVEVLERELRNLL